METIDTESQDLEHSVEDGIRRLISYAGENAEREGLLETPKRVRKAFKQMTVGYGQEPAHILRTSFESDYDQMIVLSNVQFYSLCEHHLLPFIGKATVGYIPQGGRVVGLSKLARLVDCFARRFQIQEQMTQQIANSILKELKPLGVGVVIQATHMCMTVRGVGKQDATMTTSKLHGIMREGESRQEFLRFVR